jgi:hypothetical protein
MKIGYSCGEEVKKIACFKRLELEAESVFSVFGDFFGMES